MLDLCYFDKDKCEKQAPIACASTDGEYNETMMVWAERPLHDWTSHAADAFRYLAIGYRETSDWGQPIRRNLKGIV